MSTPRIISRRLARIGFWLFLLFCLGVISVVGVFAYYSNDLPSTKELKNYSPKTATRLFDANGGLLAEFADEKRVFVPIESIPDVVKNAFIAAEDQNFYTHSGIDVTSIFRAVIHNATAKLSGQGGMSGGSTITQQVVKNLLLTNERSITRKIKEAILAIRVTKTLPKNKILEIYLNEIFLGNRSYGVVAASYNYFNKSVDELNIEEAALLAAMPKAPSQFDPSRNYDRAFERRNWVIDRMLDEEFITKVEAEKAKAKPIDLVQGKPKEFITTHFSEEIRRWLIEKYGRDVVYTNGLVVRTTIDPRLQRIAEKALFEGITNYDRIHGWRGPITKIEDLELWKELLGEIPVPDGLDPFQMGVVLESSPQVAKIGLKDGSQKEITYEGMKWARRWYKGQVYGQAPRNVSEILKVGDVIAVGEKTNAKGEKYATLEQIPDVNGAMMVMDPQTGRVLAMVGGYTYGKSDFNRATQAYRQPGSSFKPFVYLTALENGFLPSTIVNDGPITVPQGPGLPDWTPKNYSNDFMGPIPLKTGLAKSRNNVTVLLALMVGVDKIQEMAKRMGILDNPSPYYSMVLGASETTLQRMTNAYSMIANYGKETKPILIDRIQDRNGKTIYIGDTRKCEGCQGKVSDTVPTIIDERRQLIEPAAAYQLMTILQEVVNSGTATRAKSLNRPLAGKTGTTNDSYDTWFMGISPDMVVGTYVGFDNPKTLGKDATGASVPLPIFISFLGEALKDVPAKPFKIPAGVRFKRVDVSTGGPADEYSSPSNIRLEVVNPAAPDTIQYSDEYRERFMGGYNGDQGFVGGGSAGGGSSHSVESGIY
jgi:penicillin-binding protein 1A